VPSVEKISVALPPEMVSRVREAVESGEYASSSEVIREALRDWSRKRLPQANSLDDLRRIWKEAIADDSPGLDPEPVFARLHQKYRAMAKAGKKKQ
jgi:antitoxin ParD1/3/4